MFPNINFQNNPETIRIGFVPLVDCAPLILAHEKGFFRAEGLNVELVREPGWATIRDKIVCGELHAAHALAGLCFGITIGLQEMSFLGADAVMKSNTCLCMGKFLTKFELEQSVIGLCF